MRWTKIIPFNLKVKLYKIRQYKDFRIFIDRYLVGALHSHIDRSVRSNNWRMIIIGKEAQIHRGTLLHLNNITNENQIIIGARVFIGQYCYFSAGKLIDIGRDCLIGASCNFLGAGHEYSDPTIPYAKARIVSYGRIILEQNSWIGTGSTIIGDIRIGFGTVVAANTTVRNSLPPLCLAAGNPMKIVKLFNWDNRQWKSVTCCDCELDVLIKAHLNQLPTIDEFNSALDINLK